MTFSCFRRRAFLSRDRTCRYTVEALERARSRHGFHVWAYVIMPEHVHLLLWSAKESYSISGILKSIKQSVARRAVRWLRMNNPPGLRCLATGCAGKPYQFWQDGGGFDRNVFHAEALRKMLTYIHDNPVRRGLVERPEDWTWSSAVDWAGEGTGPVRIDKKSFLNSMA